MSVVLTDRPNKVVVEEEVVRVIRESAAPAQDSSQVPYTNVELVGVTNVKGALDALLGGSGLADNFVTIATLQDITGDKNVSGVFTFDANPVFNDDAIPQAKIIGLLTDLSGLAAGIDAANAARIAADNALQTDINTRALDSAVVHIAGAETITGNKTFASQAVGQIPAVFKGFAGQTANVVEFQNSSGFVNALVGASGTIGVGSDLRIYSSTDAGSSTRRVLIPTGAAGIVGLVVRGAASQTADLQQWQDSTGAAQARLLIGGGFIASGVLSTFGDGNTIANTTMAVYARDATRTPIVARGAASQSANLHEWQDSAATVLLRVTSSGSLGFGASNQGYVNYTGSPNNLFKARNAAHVPLAVQGIASQTGDLTQWQDSAAASLAVVDAAGRFATTGTIRVGNASPASTVQLYVENTGGASNVVGYFRGAASQTGDLTQWLNSTGTVLGRIDASGNVGIGIATGTAGTPTLAVSPRAVNNIGLTVRGIASQTGNLQEWQDSAAALLARVDNTGMFIGTKGMFVLPSTTTAIGFTVKGNASQTGDLQQWQDSAGAILSLITASGSIKSSAIVAGSTSQSAAGANLWAVASGSTQIAAVVKGAASQTANLTEWRDSANAVLARIAVDGTVFASGLANPSAYTNAFIATNTGGSVVTTAVAANKALVIRNDHATPTGDLTQWQNNAGTAIARLQSDGAFLAGATTTSYIFSPTASPANRFQATGAAIIPLVVRGVASQTAALQEWRDSTDAMLASISSAGILNASDPTATGGHRFGGTAAGNTEVTIDSRIASWVGLVVRGRASQTGDLQEWQDSAATVLAKITATGDGIIKGFLGAGGATTVESAANGNLFKTSVSSYGIRFGEQSSGTKWIATGVNKTAFDNNYYASTGSNNLVGHRIMEWGYPGYLNFMVQTYAGADGTLLAPVQQLYLDQNGRIGVGNTVSAPAAKLDVRGDSGSNSLVGRFVSGAAGNVVLSVEGASSQTADLFRILDSGGNYLMRTTAAGDVSIGDSAPVSAMLNLRASTDKIIRIDNTSSTYQAVMKVSGTNAQFGAVNATSAQIITDNTVALTAKAGTRDIGIGSTSITARLSVAGAVTTTPVAILRGVASQTASLMEYQDSAGSLLHSVTSAGLQKWSSGNTQTTVGAAGTASAIPVLPTRYLKVVDSDGTTLVIPAFAAA